MLLVVCVTYILIFACPEQVLGNSLPTNSLKLRDGPKVRFPRETQSQITISASQPTSFLSSNPTSTTSITITTTGCSLVAAMLSYCDDISPGFSTLSYTDQTSCLCYPNTTAWMPEVFDDAILTCAELVAAVPTVYPQVGSLVGFCTRSTLGGSQSTENTAGIPTLSVSITTQVTSTEIPTPTTTNDNGNGNGSCNNNGNGNGSGNCNTIVVSAYQGIQNLTTGDKVGIGIGGGTALGLVGFCLYLARYTKKRQPHVEGAEEPRPVFSPQNQTVRSASEKGFPESPEIHETEIVLPKRVTV